MAVLAICWYIVAIIVPALAQEGMVRLVSGTTEFEGRVEIFHNSEWGTVCDDYWDRNDADVVCRQLGYGQALEAKQSAYFGEGSSSQPIFLDEVDCLGSEYYLSACGNNGWGVHDCGHHEDAGVICDDEGAVRLVSGTTEFEGRVEIFHNSEWGTVCDDYWDRNDADVVCRQLGYGQALEAKQGAYFGQGLSSQPIFLDDVDCSGSEYYLSACGNNGWGVHDCLHSEDAGVICDDDIYEGDVRLVDGSSSLEGRVEIYHNGEWGTVCDDMWDLDDALVVCRQLGYDLAVRAPSMAYFGEGRYDQPIFLDDVGCTGYELKLSYCYSRGWGNHDCGHGEDAGVVCAYEGDPYEGDVRLLEGSSSMEGRIEIYHNNEWGTVCDDSWDLVDASVVCKQLGYERADQAPRYAYFGSGNADQPIFLDEVACSGYETQLSDCYNRGWGIHDCNHMEDAGAVCTNHKAGMEGWLIAVIVVSSLFVFSFLLALIGSACSTKKQTPSPTVFSVSGNPAAVTTTSSAQSGMQPYPTQSSTPSSAPPPSYNMAVMMQGPQGAYLVPYPYPQPQNATPNEHGAAAPVCNQTANTPNHTTPATTHTT